MKTRMMLGALLMTGFIFSGISGIAWAGSGPVKEGGGVVLPPVTGAPAVAETEPNDDCLNPDALQIGVGIDGQITLGDEDWYEFTVTGGDLMSFRTQQVAGQDPMDTTLFLVDTDCSTILAVQDDISGVDLFSFFHYTFETAGTYWLVVTGYDHVEVGLYTLIAEVYAPPAPNNTCDTAIDLRVQNLQEFHVNTCFAGNEYDPGPSNCDQNIVWGMGGPELVYSIDFSGGEFFSVTMNAEWDGALYLVNSCQDVSLSCVAIADAVYGGAPEVLEYMAIDAGTYYLIIDAEAQCGEAHIIINSPVPATARTWGALKTIYRR